MPDQPRVADPESLAEIERLRALVGPDESSYQDLVDELATARDTAKALEVEAGQLRATVTEMAVDLHRARQDQFHIERLLLRPAKGVLWGVRRVRRRLVR